MARKKQKQVNVYLSDVHAEDLNQIRNFFRENRLLVKHTASGAVGKIIADYAGMLRTLSKPVRASESDNLIFKCIDQRLVSKTRLDAEKAKDWDYVVKLVQSRTRGLEKLVADQKSKLEEYRLMIEAHKSKR